MGDHETPCERLVQVESEAGHLKEIMGEVKGNMSEMTEKLFTKMDSVNTTLSEMVVQNSAVKGDLKIHNRNMTIKILIGVIALLVGMLATNFFEPKKPITIYQEMPRVEAPK